MLPLPASLDDLFPGSAEGQSDGHAHMVPARRSRRTGGTEPDSAARVDQRKAHQGEQARGSGATGGGGGVFRHRQDVAPVREDERGERGSHGQEPQTHREERGALRGPEALVEVDLRDVLSHQRADRDPGEGVHDAGEDEEQRLGAQKSLY